MKNILIAVSILLITACSKESNSDNNDGGDSSPTFNNVTVIGKKNGNVYQTNFDEITIDRETETQYNLTNELNLKESYDYLNIEENIVTFYDNFYSNLTILQKNVSTQDLKILPEEFCPLDSKEAIVVAMNSKDRIILVTREVGFILYVRIYNPVTGTCTKSKVGNGYGGTRTTFAMAYGNSVYLNYDAVDEQQRVVKVAIETGQIIEELIFPAPFRVAFNNNLMYVFSSNRAYSIFDADTFELISNHTTIAQFPFATFNPFVKTKFKNNKVLIDLPYPQPSSIGSGPALLNLETGTIDEGSDGFVFVVSNELNKILPGAILRSYAVDIESNQIIFGAAVGPFNNEKGTIVYTNFKGTIEKYIQLDYLPDEIIIR